MCGDKVKTCCLLTPPHLSRSPCQRWPTAAPWKLHQAPFQAPGELHGVPFSPEFWLCQMGLPSGHFFNIKSGLINPWAVSLGVLSFYHFSISIYIYIRIIHYWIYLGSTSLPNQVVIRRNPQGNPQGKNVKNISSKKFSKLIS